MSLWLSLIVFLFLLQTRAPSRPATHRNPALNIDNGVLQCFSSFPPSFPRHWRPQYPLSTCGRWFSDVRKVLSNGGGGERVHFRAHEDREREDGTEVSLRL